MKIKFAEYVRLHRIVTGLNPRSVWETLATQGSSALDTMLADNTLSMGFKAWLAAWKTQLESDFTATVTKVHAIFQARPQGEHVDRRSVALYFTAPAHSEFSSLLFALLDHRDITDKVWKRLRPAAGATFRQDGE